MNSNEEEDQMLSVTTNNGENVTYKKIVIEERVFDGEVDLDEWLVRDLTRFLKAKR